MSAPTLAGYDVLEPLGAGGSATVWRARRRVDDLPVALKVLHPEGGDLASAFAEAGLLSRVRHPHVIRLYDVLPLEGASGRPEAVVLVTQLAAGGSLAQLLSRRGLLSPGEVVTVLHPLATTLAQLHRDGVVHGDLSTGNVLFRGDGMPLLADLGTARVVGEPGLRGLGTGGDEGMVAPEVIEGFPAAAAADVYQLGALAWLCLVGDPPGPGFDRPGLADVAPELSPVVLDLVTRCLAPEPEDRPDAEELAGALMDMARPEPVEVAPEADALHGVTQRLRQVALVDEAAQEGPAPGRWRRRVSTRSGLHRAGRTARDPADPRPAQPSRPRQLVAVSVVLLVVATVTMVLLALWPRAEQASTPAERESAPSGPASAASSGEGPVAESPRAQVAPEQRRPDPLPTVDEQALQRLLDRRSAAWQSADPSLLTEVVAADSPAEEAEREALERARETGTTYPEVVFRVQRAEVIEERDDALVVEALVWRAGLQAYQGTQEVGREDSRLDLVRFEVVAGQQGWLLRSWEVPDPQR